MKKYLLIFGISLLVVSCNETPKDKNVTKETTQTAQQLDVDALYSDIESLVGKEIVVSGTVDHVCKHSGKRAFIFSKDENTRIKIEAGGEIRGFDAELIGNEIQVTGVLKENRIDDAYINKLEDNLAKMDHHALGEENEQQYKTQKEQIEKLKSEIAESEKGYLSTYYIDGLNFNKIEKAQ